MNAVRSGTPLAALALPFALYAAWQVHAATRFDAVSTPPAAEPRQLSAASREATTWSNEVRKAAEVTWQFRGATPGDASREPQVDAVAKAAAARAADLADLDRFLSGAEKPKFEGRLKPRYEEWAVEQAAARRAEGAVTAWLARPPAVASAADATQAMAAFEKLAGEYAARGRFANPGRVAEWRLRARLGVIGALAPLAAAQYADAARAKLPLERGANAIATAVGTLRGLRGHLDALGAELKQAEESKVPLDPKVRTDAARQTAAASEYAAREELLSLFAKDDLFADPTGAEAWLKRVAAQYARTQDRDARALIRTKVQEFADAFVPPAVALDENVLVKGKPVARGEVVIRSQGPNGKTERVRLTGELTEFNVTERYPGEATFVVVNGTEYEPRDLTPTELSGAADEYTAARAKVTDRPSPRWTPEALAGLKKRCEARRELVDQLKGPTDGVRPAAAKAATRVLGLAAGMAAAPELFAADR